VRPGIAVAMPTSGTFPANPLIPLYESPTIYPVTTVNATAFMAGESVNFPETEVTT
jgi:hypothetical protein